MSIYFIDSNIVMYAVGKEHEYKESCGRVLQKIGDDEITGVINTEVLQEILYRYFKIGKGKEGLETARDFFLAVSEVLPVTSKDIEKNFSLFEKYKDFPPRDSLHVAVMLNNGLNEIISTDKHFDKIKEVTRIDPRRL